MKTCENYDLACLAPYAGVEAKEQRGLYGTTYTIHAKGYQPSQTSVMTMSIRWYLLVTNPVKSEHFKVLAYMLKNNCLRKLYPLISGFTSIRAHKSENAKRFICWVCSLMSAEEFTLYFHLLGRVNENPKYETISFEAVCQQIIDNLLSTLKSMEKEIEIQRSTNTEIRLLDNTSLVITFMKDPGYVSCGDSGLFKKILPRDQCEPKKSGLPFPFPREALGPFSESWNLKGKGIYLRMPQTYVRSDTLGSSQIFGDRQYAGICSLEVQIYLRDVISSAKIDLMKIGIFGYADENKLNAYRILTTLSSYTCDMAEDLVELIIENKLLRLMQSAPRHYPEEIKDLPEGLPENLNPKTFVDPNYFESRQFKGFRRLNEEFLKK